MAETVLYDIGKTQATCLPEIASTAVICAILWGLVGKVCLSVRKCSVVCAVVGL